MPEAWEAFKTMALQGFKIRSRADVGGNFLLMVPAGFFGMGLVWARGGRFLNILIGVVVLIVCLAVSCISEFSQIFLRRRTSALSDIVMQTSGAVAGISAWFLWGRDIWRRLFERNEKEGSLSSAEKILWGYLIVLIFYHIAPLDVIISPVAIYHKFTAGRLVLVPFSFDYGSLAAFAYATVTDFLIWSPVGFLWILTGKKSPGQAWLWAVCAVTIVEAIQIFIGSRIFDVTDILLGIVGSGTGILLGLKMPSQVKGRSRPKGGGSARYRLTWVGLVLACFWCLVLAAVFWYPYEFRIERAFVEGQIEHFFRVPFFAYYYSQPLHAFSAMLRKILFFVPLGAFVGVALQPFRRDSLNSLFLFLSLLLITGVGMGIELGQVIMPRKISDSTDLFFEVVGGVFGYCLIQFIAVRKERKNK
ncbi:MAG: VanZ family protein [Desulfobacteraceae bacterium]